MTGTNPPPPGDRTGLLDPGTRAVAALVLAVAGLLGTNVVQAAVQLLIGGVGGGDPRTWFAATALGTAVTLGLALWLAREPARDQLAGWTTVLARAAVVVSVVGLAGAVLTLLGALVRTGY